MRKMKNTLIICLTVIMILNLGTVAFASERPEVDRNKVFANRVPDLKGFTIYDIKDMSQAEINRYFEEAFNTSPNNFTYEEKVSAVQAVSVVENYASERKTAEYTPKYSASVERLPTKWELDVYQGSKGVTWVRDTAGKSPLTLQEAILGSYTLEYAYVPYAMFGTLATASQSLTIFNLIANAASPAIVAEYVARYMKVPPNLTIKAIVVSTVVSIGWSALNTLNSHIMQKAFDKMNLDISMLMKVEFATANNVLMKIYTPYTAPLTKFHKSSSDFTYFKIANPSNGLYGTWYDDEIGHLYSLGD